MEATISGVNRVWAGSEPKLIIMGQNHSEPESAPSKGSWAAKQRGLQRRSGSRGQCQSTAEVPFSKALSILPINPNGREG